MKKLTGYTLLAGMILPMLLLSCSRLFNETDPEGKGRLAIYVTDAPFPASLVDQVLVTIDRIGLRYEGGDCKPLEGDNKDEFECMEGFILVTDEPVVLDLMKLRNGITELLADIDLPVGKYDMIRLYVTEAEIVLSSGQTCPIKVPGGSASGIKIFLSDPVEVAEDGMSEILVDFDLSRSFVALGNTKSKHGIKGFIFKPVIRAVDYSKSNTIRGKVTDSSGKAIEEALVTLCKGEEEVTTALTNEEGEFVIIGIPHGTYRISVQKDGFRVYEASGILADKKKVIVKNIKLIAE